MNSFCALRAKVSSDSLPERFREHVVRHALAVTHQPGAPLILAIQGPPGSGKSFQANLSLLEAGFQVFRLSGSLLGGDLEGEGVKRIQELYGRAAAWKELSPRGLPALLIEDFDLSPASQHDDTRYTVNSQLLAGFMMNLADDVAMCGLGTIRLPVFLTGNDFSALPGPLVRPGRMDFFTWRPSGVERAQILRAVLREFVGEVSDDEIAALSRQFAGQSISAFAAAGHRAAASFLYHAYAKSGDPRLETLNKFAGQRTVSLLDIKRELLDQTGAMRKPGRFGGITQVRC
jgi:SpoVK/Ycf46/Vps4 family AAA+-type ATPase